MVDYTQSDIRICSVIDYTQSGIRISRVVDYTQSDIRICSVIDYTQSDIRISSVIDYTQTDIRISSVIEVMYRPRLPIWEKRNIIFHICLSGFLSRCKPVTYRIHSVVLERSGVFS